MLTILVETRRSLMILALSGLLLQACDSSSGLVSSPDDTVATDPAEPTEPTDPAKSTEPTDPAKPTESTDPAKPTEPTDPTKPTEPTDSAKPTELTDPAEPTEPTDPMRSNPPNFQIDSVPTLTYTDNEWLTFKGRRATNLSSNQDQNELSRYGGWTQQKRTATGYFRVEKIDDRWWAIDPDGYLFIHKAITSVNLNDLSSDQIHQLLTDNGFNGMGNWSDEGVIESSRQAQTPLAYTPGFSFLAEYRRDRIPRIEMPVFDDEFVTFAKENAQVFAKYVNDPNVFGYFSDNELSWTVNGLDAHIKINDPTDKNYLAAANFLQSRGKTDSNYNDIDVDKYTELMAEAYFSAVGPAIKAVDSNHMYLGPRLNKSWRRTEGFMRIAGQHMDVIAINHYHRWGTRDVEINNIVEWTGKPVIVTEFYAMESTQPKVDVGAGWRVDSQESRAAFHHNFITSMASGGNTIGWHWFKYQDDENGNKGVLSTDGDLFTDLLQSMREMNNSLYQYISFLDSLPEPDAILTAEADAYFQGNANFGSDPELQIKNANANFARETYLRFDVSSLSSSVRSAVIKLHSVATEKEAGSYKAELVTNNTWDEATLSSANNPAGSVVLGTWSHGDDVEIDVTDVIRNGLASDSKLSIKIVSLLNNGSKPAYGSREHPTELAHPKLFIHYE